MKLLRKHGTYRPNLAKLVASNSVQDIRKATENAFAIYESNKADYVKSVTALNKLKGIGPATASLVLACYDPINVPFFSDELFRYFHWADGKLKGWDRKINYTMKEYKDMYEKVQTLRRRLEKASKQIIKAVDIEKMAYSIGKAQLEIGTSTSDEDKDLLPPPPKRRKREVPEPSNDPISV